jgi:hypothetical protein
VIEFNSGTYAHTPKASLHAYLPSPAPLSFYISSCMHDGFIRPRSVSVSTDASASYPIRRTAAGAFDSSCVTAPWPLRMRGSSTRSSSYAQLPSCTHLRSNASRPARRPPTSPAIGSFCFCRHGHRLSRGARAVPVRDEDLASTALQADDVWMQPGVKQAHLPFSSR